MTTHEKRKCLTAFLLVALVAGSNICPTVYQHAHVGGDVAHDHRVQLKTEHYNSHEHGDHGHSLYQVTHFDTLMPAESHAHTTVLGIDLTLPMQSDDHSESEDEGLPRIVQVIDDCVWTTINKGNPSIHLAATNLRIPSDDILTSFSTRYTQSTTTIVRLCDSARHERSGVQLF